MTTSELKREISEIEMLVSRHKFLEADQDCRATIADTDEEEDRLLEIHHDELREIERKLSTLVPESFSDVYSLLEFAAIIVEDGGMVCGSDADIIKNLLEGLPPVRRDEMDAVCEKARQEGIAHTRESVKAIV